MPTAQTPLTSLVRQQNVADSWLCTEDPSQYRVGRCLSWKEKFTRWRYNLRSSRMVSATPTCPVCNAEGNDASSGQLLSCGDCGVLHYCGKYHQLAHREDHMSECNAVKNSQKKLVREEAQLRAQPGDVMTPAGATIFEDHVGHFWGILETRSYVRARFAVVEALLNVETYAAVAAADGNFMEMLRLCRSDNLGVREYVSAVKLRLAKGQECDDFCKWWATTGEEVCACTISLSFHVSTPLKNLLARSMPSNLCSTTHATSLYRIINWGDFDWGDMSNPYLDVKDAGMFEQPNASMLRRFCSLAHNTSITLLKTRLLREVRALQSASMLASKAPQEIVDIDRGQYLTV